MGMGNDIGTIGVIEQTESMPKNSKSHRQVYQATHLADGKSDSFMNRSFISFSYGGKNIEDFNLIACINGDRMEKQLTGNFNDLVTTYDVINGQYYWGTYFTNNELSFTLATDGITQPELEDFIHWFKPGEIKELILAEHPNRAIMARVSEPPTLSTIPFEEKVEFMLDGKTVETSTTLYKGEIQLNFTMDEPFWYSKIGLLARQKDDGTGPIAPIIRCGMAKGNMTQALDLSSVNAEKLIVVAMNGDTDNKTLGTHVETLSSTLTGTTLDYHQYSAKGDNRMNYRIDAYDLSAGVSDLEISLTDGLVDEHTVFVWALIGAGDFVIGKVMTTLEAATTGSNSRSGRVLFGTMNGSGVGASGGAVYSDSYNENDTVATDDPGSGYMGSYIIWFAESNTWAKEWQDANGENVLVIYSKDALKIIYEDNIPTLPFIDDLFFDNKIFLGNNLFFQKVGYNAVVGYAIVGTAKLGYYDYLSKDVKTSLAVGEEAYLYYAGTAPEIPTINFSFKPLLNSDSLIELNNEGSKYSYISITSTKEKKLLLSLPSAFYSYNQIINIFKDENIITFGKMREKIRENVHHYYAKKWASSVLNYAENIYNNLESNTRNIMVNLMKKFLLNKGTNAELLVNIYYFDAKNNKYIGNLGYRIAGDVIPEQLSGWDNFGEINDSEEDISEIIHSEFLTFTEKNHLNENYNVNPWNENDKLLSYKITHNFNVPLENFIIEYKNKYY